MHLLKATPGRVEAADQAVRLVQSPGDIVFLSAADTELAALAAARAGCPADFPSLRVASLLQLGHPMTVDLYLDEVVAKAKLVVARVIGGLGYWSYGIERIAASGIPCAFLPGDERPDEELMAASSLDRDVVGRLWRYCLEGGPANMRGLLDEAAGLVGYAVEPAPPVPLPRAGFYRPGEGAVSLDRIDPGTRPVVPIVFYRALLQAGDLAPVDALVAALDAQGLAALPIHVSSLKDPVSVALLTATLARHPPDAILNLTGFAVSTQGGDGADNPFLAADCPVLQVILASQDEATWRGGQAGLPARDLAMNVALPEIDGRIITRAISFKSAGAIDPLVDSALVRHRPVADRVDFVARIAAGWVRLRRAAAAERRVGLVIASYPGQDGRIGCGVGLDTPASAIGILDHLGRAGYVTDAAADDGDRLMRALAAAAEPYQVADYLRFFGTLPEAVQQAVRVRWGEPVEDPDVLDGAFRLRILRAGNVAVLVQPSRGPGLDPRQAHHDLALVPPHSYLAAYGWLRSAFDAHAIIHLGKHGTLEWLPGKAVALSAECLPEVVLGPVPHLYPFIVNDPGEGSQAKRRAQAVIIDHLTPPLTRAEAYGPLAELERLVDEYYEAAGVDPRRLVLLRDAILDLAARSGLDRDCGILAGEPSDSALSKLDNHLCELKELQIRDGLHIFGVSPTGDQLTDLLVALTRQPRGSGTGGDASLTRALAHDLDLDFDPLIADLAAPWAGPRPPALAGPDAWRSTGDTVERIELLARALVGGTIPCEAAWDRTRAVLDAIDVRLRPSVEGCAIHEYAGLLKGLAGSFVPSGPSGAPTRGRLDVLPTGRNFHALDSRAVPTPTAWLLGWRAAGLLIDRYRQDEGDWPKRMAITAWGTANMRTGGDDIAQALALMGVRPTWDGPSHRVTGYEILPQGVLDRPRVDVTLRISGFFRDAFPAQVDLFDAAARAVAALDEPDHLNPLAARVRGEAAALEAIGIDPALARLQAGARVFGAAPGRYGSGLEALLTDALADIDVADTYLAAGGFAYGAGLAGTALQDRFADRLAGVEAVVQNQDNREHDLLDSDAYWGFEAGLAATVTKLRGTAPAMFHADTANPEHPRIRTLAEEMARVVRGRAANPKWLAGVMRHGHKGAAEIAATVDYLAAFAGLVPVVTPEHFEAIYDAYVADDTVRNFLITRNPAAARAVGRRLGQMIVAGRWQPRHNRAHDLLQELQA
ncbi:MAG TPA: cobaltochelatase subunit CobN [Aliidongia sp.]|uniref:cobaltochelatase subunit CobN n=1 Tax=Aliidongia sp. TaxID=1914230 RepID=UPI002DDD9EBE|nr:cobaltochelatase subunit CobN [Aliidongia sp.]HEV2676497.1 cobaltochelatase subunit CobN [Aliidongia sp.]